MLTHDYSNCLSDAVYNAGIECSTQRSKNTLSKHILNQLKDVGYSMHSIIHSMETFAEAVHEMDETILIPSRLKDLKIENIADCKSIAALVNLPDLYTLYSTVQKIRTQLQWGGKEGPSEQCEDVQGQTLTVPTLVSSGSSASLLSTVSSSGSSTGSTTSSNGSNGTSSKSHTRRPSTASMTSINSSAASVISESESEGSVENDSGIDADMEKKVTSLDNIELNFQKHLKGLKDTLKQLTEAARYVTKRYQKDVLGVL